MNQLLLETEITAQDEAVSELRRLLDQVTRVSVAHPQIRHRVALCLSECLTNLVQHAIPRPSHIGVRFGSNTAGWWLELTDDSQAWDPTVQETANALSCFEPVEHGRGVVIARSQCDDMTYLAGSDTKPNSLRLSWLAPTRRHQPCVLIVEDDNALRRLYAAYLSDTFVVKTAVDGQDAEKTIDMGGIDLILSDIRMPKMDGMNLRQTLNRKHDIKLTPFIFLTSANDPTLHEQANSLGVDGYLVKPVDKTRLVRTIQQVLERTKQVYRQLTDRIDTRISQSLTPRLPETAHGWRLCVANRHTGVGGGDILLYNEGRENLLLTLGDIMGHDDSAKFFSYAYAGYLRGLMHANDLKQSPDKLLGALSESALQDALLSQVTLTCCCAALSEGGHLTMASAGHPPPMRITSNGAYTLTVGGVLPGLLPSITYEPMSITLSPGERVALYTDGLFESAEDEPQRRKLEARITETLTDSINQPIDDALTLAMDVFDRMAGAPPRDDALLLLMEPLH